MSRIANELGGREKRAAEAGPFKLLTVLIVFLIAAFGFAAATVLSGYAEDLEPKDRRGAHAQSQSAIGYAGVRKLLEETGRDVRTERRSELDWLESGNVRVFTLDSPRDLARFADYDTSILSTLVVLPKWDVEALQRDGRDYQGSDIWVQRPQYRDEFYSASRVGYGGSDARHAFEITREDGMGRHTITEGLGLTGLEIEIEGLQYLGLPTADDGPEMGADDPAETASEDVEEGIEDLLEMIDAPPAGTERISAADDGDVFVPELLIDGHPVLFTVRDYGEVQYHVLTEPDLLNTKGLVDADRAKLALAILDHMRRHFAEDDTGFEASAILFDLSLHGYGTDMNIIKTLTQPPFLAATLCLLAAVILVIWRGFVRFGDPVPSELDLALGKRTLVDNGARLIRLARRATSVAGGYVGLQERRLLKALRVEGAREERVRAVIRARETAAKNGDAQPFDALAANVQGAADPSELVLAAQSLHDRRQELSNPN